MGKRAGLTTRAAGLSIVLSAVYTVVNTYLSVNFGMGFGFSAITILLAYGLFHKLGGGSDKRELAICVIAAGMALPVAWALAFTIFAYERLEGFSAPWWLAPHGLGDGRDLPWSAWLVPLSCLLIIAALSAAMGLVTAFATLEVIRRAKRMVFPFYRVPATIIDACFKGGGKLRLVAYFMGLGFAITFAQHVLEALGVPAALLDFSPYLPPGFIMGMALSTTFIACGFMVGPSITLSMLISSLLAFTLIVPYLVSIGALPARAEPMELYGRAISGFLISPALGMMLVGGLLVSIFRKLIKRLRGAPKSGNGRGCRSRENRGQLPRDGDGAPPLGYGELLSRFFRSIASNRRLLTAYLALLAATAALAYALNPLAPLSPLISTAIAILSATLLSALDFAIIVKMAGELGMTSGTHQFWLYAAPVLATGYSGYAPYIAMPGKGDYGAWEGSLVIGYSVAMEGLGIKARDVARARVVCCWLMSFFASAAFILLAWRSWGLGSPQMPCINLMLGLPIMRMIAERRIAGVIDPLTFTIGALAGGLLEALTPLSMMGLAIGLVMPPYYSVSFAAGGLARAVLEHKRGREWCGQVGILVASALIASSVMAQLASLVLTLVL